MADTEESLIQITTLQPACRSEMISGAESRWKTDKIPPRISAYYLSNEVDVFSFVRVLKEPPPTVRSSKSVQNEVSDRWVEKTFVVTEEKLPCLRRRVPVIEENVRVVSPIEFAVSSIRERTNLIKDLIVEFKNIAQGERVDVGPLSLQLQGVVESPVQGGVQKFTEVFLTDSYIRDNPTHAVFIDQFKHALKSQLPVLKMGLTLYKEKAPKNLLPHAVHLEQIFAKTRAQYESLGLLSSHIPDDASVMTDITSR
eukprot:1010901_1